MLALVLACALATRVSAAFWWQARLPDAHAFAYGDSTSYWVLGQQIVRGEPYRYGIDQSPVFRTPGYPLLLAGMFSVLGDNPPVIWARLLGAVMGTATVGAVICLARQCFDPPTACVAGLMAAVYPGAIGMSVFVLTEGPFCLAMLGQLICWVKLARGPGPQPWLGWAVAVGVLAGIATLMRPSWLLFTPFAIGTGLLYPRPLAKSAVQGTVVLLAFAVTMAPWWIRNYQVTGSLVVTTLQTGASLYDGLSPTATGASDMRFVAAFYQAQRDADANASTPPTGVFAQRLDNRLQDAALTWAANHPGRVVKLMLIKFGRMWSPWPNAAELQSWTFRLLISVGYTPLIILAAWGVVRNRHRGWPLAICILPAIYFSGLHMIFVSSIRYRQPAMLPLIVLAAAALVGGLTRFSSTTCAPECTRATKQPPPAGADGAAPAR